MMMEDDILIARFLRNELSDEEQAAFLKRLESDDLFKEQVKLEQQLLNLLGETYWSYAINDTNKRIEAYKNILKSDDTQELKITISKAIESYKRKQLKDDRKEASPRKGNFQLAIRIAAIFVILCSLFWYFSNNSIDHKALTDAAWQKNIGLDFTVRNGSSDSTKAALTKALHLYTNKEYNQALSTLKAYSASSNHYKDILLVRALSYHQLNKTTIAFQTLDSLAIYAPDISKWYKGLIHLENDELKKAAQYLEIPSTSNQEIKLKK